MFNNKKIKGLRLEVDALWDNYHGQQKAINNYRDTMNNLNRQVAILKIDVKQLKCKHEHTEYLIENDCGYWTEECLDCDKTLNEFDSELELRESEADKKEIEAAEAMTVVEKLKEKEK